MTDRYDIVVVGGGIHGVGVAQAAAAGGFSALLLEKKALAAGTSSCSSKLVHGGLRYLETAQISLVSESLRERRILLELAPELVHLRSFHFPIYRTTRRRPWQVRIGLSLYAMLGRLRRESRFEQVPRRMWGDLDGLITGGLQAVFRYSDAQTDDAVLTRAVMRSAQQLGATLAAPARFVGARLVEDGAVIDYCHDGQSHTCRATVLVNAAGPWAGRVLEGISPAPSRRAVELVGGAHILVRGRLEKGIYYVESPHDGRAVFVMPWGDQTLVGTTETPYEGDPDEVSPLPAEQHYLAEVLDHYFPRYDATQPGAILSSFAGLRVLPAGSGRPFTRSRETILDVDRRRRTRLLTIYGGKLTTYRATAERIMRRLAGSLPARTPVAETRRLPLSPS